MKRFDVMKKDDVGTQIAVGLIVVIIGVAVIGLGLTLIGLIWRAAAWAWGLGG